MSSHARKHPIVRLDRIQLVSWAPRGRKPPILSGFKVVFDQFVRARGKTPTYDRCRMYRSQTDGTKIFWQYEKRRGWLKPWKVTLVADDRRGLSAAHVHLVVKHCRFYRFLIVELALDFTPSTMNHDLVRRHGIFGKSRRR